jgi:hypothetical protein
MARIQVADASAKDRHGKATRRGHMSPSAENIHESKMSNYKITAKGGFVQFLLLK